MKKRIMIGIILVLIVLVLFFYSSSSRSDMSVHELNWSDVEGMNEHVSVMTFNIPPHFMGEIVETHFDLTDMFRLFSENRDLLRDQPELPGRELESDFEVVLEFTNLSGSEAFLNDKWSQETLNINFYVNRSLAQEGLDLISEAEGAYHRAQNPHLFPEIIPLSEINWSDIMNNYEAYIEEIIISRFYWRFRSEIFEFTAGENELIDILHFLGTNSDSLAEEGIDLEAIMDNFFETEEFEEVTDYTVWITFRLPDSEFREEHARPEATFYMNQELGEQLVEIIGEEALEQARRMD